MYAQGESGMSAPNVVLVERSETDVLFRITCLLHHSSLEEKIKALCSIFRIYMRGFCLFVLFHCIVFLCCFELSSAQSQG